MQLHEVDRIVAELVTKPGHEKVRGLLFKILTDGLGAASDSIDFETRVPEVQGRIDALLGRTIFEIKRDLGRERGEAEGQLLRYLPQRENETKQRFIGVATDGAEFRVYMVRDGALIFLQQFRPSYDEPRGLLSWLESVVVVSDEIVPSAEGIRRELGRTSVAYQRALKEIEALWEDVKLTPEANLKRDLWDRLVRTVYGGAVDNPN
jgi:hypothetical protein